MTTMLAAKFYGRGDLRVEAVEVPPVQKGEVKVKVAYLGECQCASIMLGTAQRLKGD